MAALIQEANAKTNGDASRGTSIAIENATKAQSTTDVASGSTTAADETGSFKFFPLEAVTPAILTDREMKQSALKWGIDTHCVFQRYRFDERFSSDKASSFLSDFFNDPNVQGTLKTSSRAGLSRGLVGQTSSVDFEELSTSVLTMDFFDRLKEGEEAIVSSSGRIRQCMPQMYDGVEGGDELREMFLNEDSEHYLLYDEDEKKELIYNILHHLVIGNGMCQPDDHIEPYFTATKAMYKDLVTVRRSKKTGKIGVTSKVFSVNSLKGGAALFPHTDSPHNMCIIVVDEATRRLTYWSIAFVSFW